MQNPAENVLQALREAFEKLEKAVQLPSRKDFDDMAKRVSELSKRIEAIEKRGGGVKKKAAGGTKR